MNKERRKITLSIIILLVVITLTIGASYAYFATVNKTTGNDKNLNIVTENLGSIKWQGTKVFASADLLPGEMGIQTFTIEKNSTSGKGIYEIDLKGIIDSVFNEDVEISLYKTTDTTSNNVTITEGDSKLTGSGTLHYSKEDELKIIGVPELVYGPRTLKNKDKIILEQKDFDNSNLQKTTYYLVYPYKNADPSQDNHQGKSFSGEISVKLILEKTPGEMICNDNEESAACKISTLAKTNDSLVYDDTNDKNLRYIGSDPNNYVSVDGELWRIIGVMNNIDDGTGKKESRIKLIRNESIGTYSWDTSETSINNGYGVNEWSQADLMKLLNPGYESESAGGSLYWNNKSGTCYNGPSNAATPCDFTSSGLKNNLKNLVDNVVWNTGASFSETILNNNFYYRERSTNTGKICSSGSSCNDTVERTTTWTGKVGLMYPSDYGYATSGGSTTDRVTCLNTNLDSWKESSVSDCKNNDWLINSEWMYTITPRANSTFSYQCFHIHSNGHVGADIVSRSGKVFPTIYLNPSVIIMLGDGTKDNAYVLGM